MKKIMDKKVIISAIAFLVVVVALVFAGKNKLGSNVINNNKGNDTPVVINEKDFNLKVIKTVNSTAEKSNYLISPYSMEIALNMLREGANGNTLKEIDSFLPKRNISIVNSDKTAVANAIFIKNKFKDIIEDGFYSTLKAKYNSEILYDEFTEPTVINNWVKENTKGMIEKILDKMDPKFVLGLANAIAIDVEWSSSFDCSSTSSEEWTNNDKKINVEMMHNDYRNVKYLKNDNETGIILPYKEVDDVALEFVAIMPNGDLADYISKLSTEKMNSLDASFVELKEKQKLILGLPRFTYSYSLENFKDILEAMGMKDAFNQEKADLTKIISKENMNKASMENIYVSDAIHKTYIELNEKGTKAAAVTYFGINEATALPEELDLINITFNKPFLYMIRDSKSKEMLFFGTVYEPSIWKGSTCSSNFGEF